jgi:hypothetical protein
MTDKQRIAFIVGGRSTAAAVAAAIEKAGLMDKVEIAGQEAIVHADHRMEPVPVGSQDIRSPTEPRPGSNFAVPEAFANRAERRAAQRRKRKMAWRP